MSVLQVKHALRGSHFAVLRAETKYRNSEVATYAYKFITGFSSGNAAQLGISENQASRAAGNAADGHDIEVYALNMLDGSILGISADLRQIALIIILTRAGLSLDIQDLKR